MKKNIVFCGFGKLALECLKRLMEENYNVIYILTHREEQKESIDTFAKHNNIDYSYKDTRQEKTFLDSILIEGSIDYIVSINYRYILSKDVFSIPKYALNIHGSLLPKYRGRTPHVWSIINGEEYTGITCHLIDEGVDTGNIIEQKTIKIDDNDTGHSLLQKFQRMYPDILINSLNKLEKGIDTIIQNELEASYYGRRTPDMGYIDFYKSKTQVINFIRAQAYPYPGAYYYLINGRKIIINQVNVEEYEDLVIENIGIIKLIDGDYYVKCRDGILKLIDYEILDKD